MGKLTAVKVKHAKPGTYIDGKGLMLLVRQTSADPKAEPSKRWILRIQVDGKRRDIGLGSAGDVTLGEARDAADAMRKAFKRGEDPLEARRRAKEPPPTFREAAKAVHKEHAPTWRNQKHAAQWLKSLETYAFGQLGDLPVDQIDGPLIRDTLAGFWLTAPETARRVMQRIGTVLDYCHAKGWREAETPMRAVRAGLPKQPKQSGHFEAMPWQDVPGLFAGMEDTLKTGEPTRLLLEFTILTATRSGESRGARWCEIDRKAKAWNIPAERMKAKKAHRVPLCDRALEILERMQELRTSAKDDALIFEGRKIGAPVSDMTMRQALRRAGLDCDVHGFRSSFKDWSQEATSFPPALAERALAHTIKDKVERAYARSDLFERRRELMAAWEAHCLSERKGAGNVTPLRRAQ